MGLPVDIPEIFKIAKDMQAVGSVPVSVSVIIDDSADGDLAAKVRAAFASTNAHTRVTVTYLDVGYRAGEVRDDFAVIVAGESPEVGRLAAQVREHSVPVMVVTDDAASTARIAQEAGAPIPPADIAAPVKLKSGIEEKVASFVPALRARVDDVTGEGPVPLTDDAFKLLYGRMGEWIITTCPDKKLTLALAFPFIRRPLADDAISATAIQNAAVGFVPIIPGADMPIMTLNQMKMILQIATAYGCPLDANRIKELAFVLGGAFLARNIARAGAKLIPFAGWAISGAVGFAATEAMGRAAVEYFEAGGDIVGIAQVVQTARDGAVSTVSDAAGTKLGQRVLGRVSQAVPGVARVVARSQRS